MIFSPKALHPPSNHYVNLYKTYLLQYKTKDSL